MESITSDRTKWQEEKKNDHDFGDFSVFLFNFCIENSWVSCYCFFAYQL